MPQKNIEISKKIILGGPKQLIHAMTQAYAMANSPELIVSRMRRQLMDQVLLHN